MSLCPRVRRRNQLRDSWVLGRLRRKPGRVVGIKLTVPVVVALVVIRLHPLVG